MLTWQWPNCVIHNQWLAWHVKTCRSILDFGVKSWDFFIKSLCSPLSSTSSSERIHIVGKIQFFQLLLKVLIWSSCDHINQCMSIYQLSFSCPTISGLSALFLLIQSIHLGCCHLFITPPVYREKWWKHYKRKGNSRQDITSINRNISNTPHNVYAIHQSQKGIFKHQ